MMLDANDVSFFPVSPAMLLSEVKSWVACPDKRASTQVYQGNQANHAMVNALMLLQCYLEGDSIDQIWSTQISIRIIPLLAK